MKILVVDDELDICEILKYNLETEGFEVDTACSAEEALEMPLKDYSLILLDVMMGEMSGFQMVRRLKNNTSTARIPIIFVTALDGEDNLVKGLNIGADDYIAKPLSMKEVKARVRLPVLRYEKNSQECRAMQFPSHLRGGARGGVLQRRVISLIINEMQPHPQPLPLVKGRGAVRTSQ